MAKQTVGEFFVKRLEAWGSTPSSAIPETASTAC